MNEPFSHDLDFLHAMLDAMPTMLFVVDSDIRIMHFNAAAAQLAGTDKDKVVLRRGGDVMNCIHAEETPEGCGHAPSCKSCVVRNSISEALAGKKVQRKPANMELVTPDGIKKVYFQITANPFDYGTSSYALLAIEDATELREAEIALRVSESRLRNITAMLGEGVYALDRAGKLTYLNPEAERLLGWTEAELLGKQIHSVVHYQTSEGAPLPAKDCPIYKTLKFGKTHRSDEEVFTRKDGTMFSVSLVATPLWERERMVGSVAAFQDITEQKRASEELKRLNELLAHQAKTDTLTGIANRLQFDNALNAEIHRSRRHGFTFSLIMFDLDRFKEINDTYGHHAGDSVLRDIAKLIEGIMRAHDLFARWGGEEFMILDTNASLENARAFAEKLRRLIETADFPPIGSLTCSFGVAEFNSREPDDAILQRVDRALYRAKELGRNRVETA